MRRCAIMMKVSSCIICLVMSFALFADGATNGDSESTTNWIGNSEIQCRLFLSDPTNNNFTNLIFQVRNATNYPVEMVGCSNRAGVSIELKGAGRVFSYRSNGSEAKSVVVAKIGG
jgi:hypothetical protein